MKKALLILMYFSPLLSQAQAPKDSSSRAFYFARLALVKGTDLYDPERAYLIYSKYAGQGNSQAMNDLANLYNTGTGVAPDEQAALSWYERSAKGGYARAWYNLGLMYKNGIGVPQDFVKACECYRQGVAAGDRMSIYALGYMQYKGFGTPQNYEEAFLAFSKVAPTHESNSMYMLGLCYRNGYGVSADRDSARYWLTLASEKGFKFAMEELALPEPENIRLSAVPDIRPSSMKATAASIQAGAKSIRHLVSQADIAGEYTGYTMKFDWSGQYIIGDQPLKLSLTCKGNLCTGSWSEEGAPTVTLTGTLTDSAMVFDNTSLSRKDHYNQASDNYLELNAARLQLSKADGVVYLAGNISLRSITHNEPEKPEFIMLTRSGAGEEIISAVNDLAASPNPIVDRIQVKYSLKQAATVRLMVTELATGRIVYAGKEERDQAGDHEATIYFNGIPGSYVVTLASGNQFKSIKLFKLQ